MTRVKVAFTLALGLLFMVPVFAWSDARAALPSEALATIRRIAIQHNGRIKPFDSFARETLQLITGTPRVGHEDPVATVLSIMADPEHWQQVPLISVPFIPLREALGMVPPPTASAIGGSATAGRPRGPAVGGGMERPQAAPVGTPIAHPASGGVPGLGRKATHISYSDLVATRKLMRLLPPIVGKQQREEKLSMLEEETMDVFQRFVALSGLLEQKLNLVPPASATDRVWLPILEPTGYAPQQQEMIRAAWAACLRVVRNAQPEAVTASARHVAQALQDLNPPAYPAPWRLSLEVFYNWFGPFRVARLVYLLAAIVLLLGLSSSASRWASLGLGVCWAAWFVHGVGIALRVVIGGRPPVSNFFETTLWLPFVGVTIALIFEQVYQARYLALAASFLAAITLVLADHLPLDSSISPVVAVLHSNLWLTIHVLTIVASYGALALATVLAHVYGSLYLIRRGAHAALPSLSLLLYRVIQVGVVLLAGGIMLGAVWANASWGRYWGWDPKETWALITLLWYLAVLHGRFAGWIEGVGLALSVIGGFFLLLMTYYGVSFYLVGLHSYAGGHAKPLPSLLIAYLVAEVAFLALVGLMALKRKRAR